MMNTYRRATDAELKENGFDPKWIVEGDCDPTIGPYVVYRETDAMCRCCYGKTRGWTVLNLATAMCIGQSWFGDNGECDAGEHAEALNAAWAQGFAAARAS